MPKTPQPGEASFRILYTYHVGRAAFYEREADRVMYNERKRLWQVNPDASDESIEIMISANHYVKKAIGHQQFHTREATKYGLGMIVEAMGHPFATLERKSSAG
jgi:hypothetical protein